MKRNKYMMLLKVGIASATFLASTFGAVPFAVSAEGIIGDDNIQETISEEGSTPYAAINSLSSYLNTYRYDEDIYLDIHLDSHYPIEYAEFKFVDENNNELYFGFNDFVADEMDDDSTPTYYSSSHAGVYSYEFDNL